MRLAEVIGALTLAADVSNGGGFPADSVNLVSRVIDPTTGGPS
jgi:hypothetical protein